MKIIDIRDKLPKGSKQYRKRELSDIKCIAIHHSLTNDIPGGKDVFAFARYHVNDLNWPGIGYHYVIDADGTIFKCNSADTISYHVGKHNRRSLGVCLVGDFRDYEPTPEQRKALAELLVELTEAYHIDNSNILGHSEFDGYAWKKCPAFDVEIFKNNL